MGPLVPEVFSNEFNFVIALIIGFFFGYILEQAGFSSSKKLAGLFYGYDFVVLRVFFTAGITAMVGVTIFGYLGWLDLSIIYINPTFLYSAIVGGLIMGAGFIIGGFCPGTSVAAASIGKIDAMVFLAGSFIGVFIFGEFYSVFQSIYSGEYLGSITIDQSFGLSYNSFVFIMIIVALTAFIVTAKIENKVNKIVISKGTAFFKQEQNKFLPYAAIFVVFGAIILFLPTRQDALMKKLEKIINTNQNEIKYIEPLELAYRVIDEDDLIVIVDVRAEIDSNKTTIPGAFHMPFEMIHTKEWSDFIKNTYKTIIYVDEDSKLSSKAAAYASILGNKRAMAMKGGIIGFDNALNYNEMQLLAQLNFHQEAELYFKKNALARLKELRLRYAAMAAPPKQEQLQRSGGC